MHPEPSAPMSNVATVHRIQRLAFDGDACRACRACEAACSLTHEGAVSPTLARINVTFDESALETMATAHFCLQCEDAPCIEACPVDAMSRHPRTGAVIIDPDLCLGCMICARACPWHIPKRHPDRRLAIKCDLCSDSEDGPACLRICPLAGKALTMEELPAGDAIR
jgi:Fe-S-cluster-containing dehydrogenase component